MELADDPASGGTTWNPTTQCINAPWQIGDKLQQDVAGLEINFFPLRSLKVSRKKVKLSRIDIELSQTSTCVKNTLYKFTIVTYYKI